MRRTLLAGLLVLTAVWLVSAQMKTLRVQFVSHSDVILQKSPVTCGPAALAYILNKRGITTTEEQLSRLAGTDTTGTNLLGLATAAQAFGISSYGIAGSYDDLMNIRLPAIAVFPDHLVVVTNVTGNEVMVADPLIGLVRYGRKAFERVWTGHLLVFD